MKTIFSSTNAASLLVSRQRNFVTLCRRRAGRVTACAPSSARGFVNGAHGVTRPTMSRNLSVAVLAAFCFVSQSALMAGDIESNIEKAFVVHAAGKLTVQADRGSVEVDTSALGQVEVKVARVVK